MGVKPKSIAERIMLNSMPEPNSGCWLWMGSMSESNGYGVMGKRISPGKRVSKSAHKLSYEAFIGPVPPKLELDHLCRVRSCVNPDHMEPVTKLVNVRRGIGGIRNRTKTHCPKGHPYSGDNLYQIAARPNYRYCRACKWKTGGKNVEFSCS